MGGKTKHPSALADSQRSLLCLSVPHCGVGEEGTEHQRVAKPRSVAWLEQQGLQCHQSSPAASEQSCRQQLPSPCQRRLRPLAQNANPAPQPRQGWSKHTNQFNSSTRGIGEDRATATSVWLSSKMQLSWESCRKSKQNCGLLTFT